MSARKPEDCDRLFGEYTNAGDLGGLVALYEPKASFVAQDGRVVTGVEGIRRELGDFVAMKPKIEMHVTKVVPAGDDLAVLYNDWRGSVGPDGDRQDMTGKAIEIVRRQADGSWRFVIDDPFARG